MAPGSPCGAQTWPMFNWKNVYSNLHDNVHKGSDYEAGIRCTIVPCSFFANCETNTKATLVL